MKTNNNNEERFCCGFIAIVGRPNAGKSMLLNNILGNKIAITSMKAQTTRNRITGILNRKDFQAIFLDTPGINVKKGLMSNHLSKIAYSSIKSSDIILFVLDAKAGVKKEDITILERIEKIEALKFIVINKIDLLQRHEVLPLIEVLKKYEFISEFFPVSAKKGTNVRRLLSFITDRLPEGERFFKDDIITDRPEEFLFSEFIREKIYRLLKEELPYCSHVEVEEIAERTDELIYVSSNIFVEKETQKGIIIGKNGKMIKEIGKKARQDIEKFTGCKVYLELRVRIRNKWTEDDVMLHRHGLTSDEN